MSGFFSTADGGITSTGYDGLIMEWFADPQENLRTQRLTESEYEAGQEVWSASNISPQERVDRIKAGWPYYWREKTTYVRDTATPLGKVDIRYLPRGHEVHDAGNKSMGARYKDRINASVLGAMRSDRRTRLAGGSSPLASAAGGGGLTPHTITVTRTDLMHIPSIRLMPWWTQISSGPVKMRLEKMHMHRYNCREPHCRQLTTALLALGQWSCKMKFSAYLYDKETKQTTPFEFYVRSDCCPPIFPFGWADRPVEVSTMDILEAIPPLIRPKQETLSNVSIRGEDPVDGSVRVKNIYNIARYDAKTVNYIKNKAEICRNIPQLKEHLFLHYEFGTMVGFEAPLITPKGLVLDRSVY